MEIAPAPKTTLYFNIWSFFFLNWEVFFVLFFCVSSREGLGNTRPKEPIIIMFQKWWLDIVANSWIMTFSSLSVLIPSKSARLMQKITWKLQSKCMWQIQTPISSTRLKYYWNFTECVIRHQHCTADCMLEYTNCFILKWTSSWIEKRSSELIQNITERSKSAPFITIVKELSTKLVYSINLTWYRKAQQYYPISMSCQKIKCIHSY